MSSNALTLDHQEFEAGDWAERYEMGELDAAEAARFEEHFLSCPECTARLEAVEMLHGELKRLAARDEGRAGTARALSGPALSAPARRPRRPAARPWLLALAAVLTLAVLPIGWLARRAERLERELAAARRDGERAAVLSTERERLEQERSRLAEALESAAARERELAGRLAETLAPQVNTLIVSLAPLRSATQEGQPPYVLTLPGRPAWVVLALELDPGAGEAFRATLARSDGTAVWQGGGLASDPSGLVTVSLRSDLLAAGDYRLTLRAAGAGPDAPPVARFAFRVAARSRD